MTPRLATTTPLPLIPWNPVWGRQRMLTSAPRVSSLTCSCGLAGAVCVAGAGGAGATETGADETGRGLATAFFCTGFGAAFGKAAVVVAAVCTTGAGATATRAAGRGRTAATKIITAVSAELSQAMSVSMI